MRLITSLTTCHILAMCGFILTGCASDSPRKPASASEKRAGDTGFYDHCYDAYSRNYPAPVGCPAYDSGYYRNAPRGRAVPSVGVEPPELPRLPSGGILGR